MYMKSIMLLLYILYKPYILYKITTFPYFTQISYLRRGENSIITYLLFFTFVLLLAQLLYLCAQITSFRKHSFLTLSRFLDICHN